MKRSLFATSALAGVTLLATACGGSGGDGASGRGGGTGFGSSPAQPTSGATVPAQTATTLDLGSSKPGQILADSQGRSPYLFEADTSGTSTCTSAGCVVEWPPLTAMGTTQVEPGLAANRLGTTTRPMVINR